jgi:hypothetical protein
MLAKEAVTKAEKLAPPNLREAADYFREPESPRCFNCAFLRVENLKFECARYGVRTSVYSICDDHVPRFEREGDYVHLILSSKQKEMSDSEPFVLVPKKRQ